LRSVEVSHIIEGTPAPDCLLFSLPFPLRRTCPTAGLHDLLHECQHGPEDGPVEDAIGRGSRQVQQAQVRPTGQPCGVAALLWRRGGSGESGGQRRDMRLSG
jgi:hypothetical protein